MGERGGRYRHNHGAHGQLTSNLKFLPDPKFQGGVWCVLKINVHTDFYMASVPNVMGVRGCEFRSLSAVKILKGLNLGHEFTACE